jgi:hypothetical protein
MNPEVALTVRARKPGRPPIQRIVVDLDVSNTSNEPRWFVLPAHAEKLGAAIAVDGVEPVALGQVVVGTFQGTGAFVTLRLAPHAHVVVHGLELSSASAVKSVEVVIARAITVDGKPAESWFPQDPTSASATVEWTAKTPLESRHTPDRHEVAVHLDVVRSEIVALR